MLESSQCEAKNLKHLLDLKDEQVNIYETKALALENENQELTSILREAKSRDVDLSNENN